MQLARARWSLETVATGAVVFLPSGSPQPGSLGTPSACAHDACRGCRLACVHFPGQCTCSDACAGLGSSARSRGVHPEFQGGLAAGSAVGGLVAARIGIPATLVIAGLSTLATLAFRAFGTLPDTTADTTPWDHWRLPATIRGS